jgi:hypothetical protein
MSKEYEDYPKGQLSLQGGELQDVFDVQCAFEDGETEVHTFRGKGQPSGSTGGKRKCTVTFKAAISQAGFERDYLGNWHKRKVLNGRLKVPGKTVSITGRLSKPSITSNIDNFIEFSVTLSGKYSFS